MSFNGADDHPDPIGPDDPLYYAPRPERRRANPRSSTPPQTRSDHLPSDPPMSRFDEMREKAFAKSIRPLESQFVYERRSARGLFATVGAIAAAIGVAAVLALVLFNALPRSKSDPAELAVSISTPASATPAEATSDDPQALLQRFQQFHGGENPDQAASEPASRQGPEKSPVLLEKFMQWQEKK
jgi:hypothetical protein